MKKIASKMFNYPKESVMPKHLLKYLLACSVFMLTACGTDEGFVREELTDRPQVAEVQFVNLIPDSPELLVSIGDTTTTIEYGQASVQGQIPIDEYELNASYFDADGEQVFIVQNESARLLDQDQLVYIFTGSLASPNLELRKFLEPQYDNNPITTGNVEVWFTSGVADPTTLDVYLTGPTTDLATVTPDTDLVTGGVSEILTRENLSSYRLRATPLNSTEVVFDSGEFVLADRSRTLFAFSEYFGPTVQGNTFPNVNAVAINSFGSNQFVNSGLPSQLRAINLTSDVPQFDLFFGSTTNAPFAANVDRLEVGSYVDIDSGANGLNLTLPGVKDQFLLQQDTIINSGTFYSLVISGSITDDTLSTVLFVNDSRQIGQRVTVNFINTALINSSTNVYFLNPGQLVADASPQIASAGTNTFSTFTARPATVDLVITSALNGSVLYGPERTTLSGGITYSFILVEDMIGEATTTEIVILEDAN
jgi:hypothetical protein